MVLGKGGRQKEEKGVPVITSVSQRVCVGDRELRGVAGCGRRHSKDFAPITYNIFRKIE